MPSSEHGVTYLKDRVGAWFDRTIRVNLWRCRFADGGDPRPHMNVTAHIPS